MPKRKRAKTACEGLQPRQLVDPTYAARVLEKMAAKVAAQQARKGQKSKDPPDRN